MTASGPTLQLAKFAAGLQLEDVPRDVIDKLKMLVLDSLGTALAASTLGDGCRETLAAVETSGGTGPCTVLGAGRKTSLLWAALANGGLMHALNYDASSGAGHIGLIPAGPLALAEARGGISGRAFLTALAAGCEITSRLSLAEAHGSRGMGLDGQLMGYFGVTAACGRLLSFEPQRMHSAFGLALMQLAGSREVLFAGDPPAKSIYGAFPNQGGLTAALLAETGVDCPIAAFEGRGGLYALYYGGRYDTAVLADEAGAIYRLGAVQFKRWPTSGIVSPFVEAALALRGELRGPIEHIHISAGEWAREWLEPVEVRRCPETVSAAANSIWYGVAKALVNGALSLEDFTTSGIREKAALELTTCMSHQIDEPMDGTGALHIQDATETHSVPVTAAGGKTLDRTAILAKFGACASFAAQPFPTGRVEQIISTVDRLETLADVTELTALLA